MKSTFTRVLALAVTLAVVVGFLALLWHEVASVANARPAIIEADGERTLKESIARQLDAGTAALRADTAIASALPVGLYVLLCIALLGYAVLGVCGVFIWREQSAHRKERG